MSLKEPSSLSAGGLERSFSSPVRTPQKSFGRLPVRVTVPAPVVVHRDILPISVDTKVERLGQEVTLDLSTIQDQEKNLELRTELDTLRQELNDLREASSKNDEVWQRENARLKEQLTAVNVREAEQEGQLRILDDQLALCRQELRELQNHQLKAEEEDTRPTEDAGSTGLGRERELLKLVVQLVGASNVRAILRDNPKASPAQLREALVRLRCPQCKSLPPCSSSPTRTTESDSLHKMLFGASSRPPSPTAIRFNSTGFTSQ